MATRADHRFARRAALRGGEELQAILAGTPPGVLSMTGGFPNSATFATEVLADLSARLLREDPAVLAYAPVEGVPSVRDYLCERVSELQGARPEVSELMVTSGGMECIGLACAALLDPGDAVAVEAPTYLGALMAFGAAEADVHGIEMDEGGLRVDALGALLDSGVRPKLLYTIPEFQNPTGRTLAAERRGELVELCRRHGVLILEDVAYRELAFDGSSLPSLWSLGPDVVVQAGTFSKVFFPGVRLGWAVGPADVVAELAAAKANTDQCASALAQRMVEEYGRGGHFASGIPRARALYESHWRALGAALSRELPDGCAWTSPLGGFLTWVALPDGLDAMELRSFATAEGVAFVPGAPFYPGDGDGTSELRLSFSALGPEELAEAAARLGRAIRAAGAAR